jgi:hypothetical protein
MKDRQSIIIIIIDGEKQAPRQRLRNRYFISRHTVTIYGSKNEYSRYQKNIKNGIRVRK